MHNNNNIPEKLLKPYNPKDTESRIYAEWEESGFFNPDVCIEKGVTAADAEVFSIVLPPPNVTGTLHTGHALMLVIQDIMVRFSRMNKKKTLWIPGTDHASIATQSKVEKILEKEEGKRKGDLGREEFLKRVEKFAQESHDTIIDQTKKMGASLDWSREAFTLDNDRNFAVRTAFKQMYDDGLIYRGHRIVNWDPKGQTVISDDEIVHEERKAKMYTFKYSKDFPISISTTRPETKIGDTAVAVNPNDERYTQFIGKEYDAIFCGVPIHVKIIADEVVEKDFGTGALGVTPAHSQTDAEIAQRHNLKTIPVINELGKITLLDINKYQISNISPSDSEFEWANKIAGKKTTEAREIIVEWLKSENLLEKEEEINQNISLAERSGGVIEPLPKLQWFINVNKKIQTRDNKTLKELMLDAVTSESIKIIPKNFENVYYNWIRNLRDWCISRQIWYGHRIPVWYCHDCNIPNQISQIKKIDKNQPEAFFDEYTKNAYLDSTFITLKKEIEEGKKSIPDYFIPIVSTEEPYACPDCGKNRLIRDSDTLDTWFSSGLWTFSTLGWPKNTLDLQTYHPTTVLETGHDILFFWVARMILMSKYLLGDIPFKTVYLHGLVRDEKGRKMSKSLGNIVNPLTLTDKYGTDALRMAMIVGVGPGSDSNLGEEKIKAYQKFANKLWNITRFILENTASLDKSLPTALDDEDTATLAELDALIAEITQEMEEFKFYIVAEKLYHYVWHTFADIVIERCKTKMAEGSDPKSATSAKQLLLLVLPKILTTLHPFMPFVTEELWSLTSQKKSLLIVEKWPYNK